MTLPLAVGGTATLFTLPQGRYNVPRFIQDYRLGCGTSTLATCNFISEVNSSITFHGAELNKRNNSLNKMRVFGRLWLEAFEDNTPESNETITLSLGGGPVTRLTLKDAPSSVTLYFSQGNYSEREDNDKFQTVLLVNTAPGQDIVVPLVYRGITATGGEDYVAEDTVTFVANGSTSHGFEINLLDDTVYEGDETFRVEIDASRLLDWVKVDSRSSAVFQIQENDARVEA